MSLSKFSISTQILIGYIPVLLTLAILAIFSFQIFTNFDDSFDDLKNITEENITFMEIERDVVELQRNILVYSYVGYRGVLKKIEYIQKRLEEKFDRIEPIAHRDGEIRDRFQRMVGHYEDYKKSFAQAVKEKENINAFNNNNFKPLMKQTQILMQNLQDRFSDENKLNEAGKVVEFQRDLLQADANIDAANKAPNGALIREARELITKMIEQSATLKAGQNNPETIQNIEKIEKNLTEYKNAIQNLSRLNRSYLNLINVVLAGKAVEIDKLSDELDTLITTRADSLQNNIRTDINTSKNYFVLLAIIAGLIGLISSILIATGIAKPVSAMAETLSALANKKADVEIPGQNRKDEVGQMAIAANEFKAMAENLEQRSSDLKQSEEQFRNALEYSSIGIALVSPKGKWLKTNEALHNILGYSEQELLEIDFQTITHPEDLDNDLKNFRDILDDKIQTYQMEKRYFHKSGRVVWALLSVSLVRDQDNKPSFFISQIQDITERRRAEQNLIAANNELEEFAYRTSHDLRSPLVSSIGLLDLAQTEIDNGNHDKVQTSIGLVRGSLKKLETLVSDLLELTKARNVEEDMLEINIETVIDEAFKKFSHMDNYKDLDIQKDLKADKTIRTLKNRMVLIIENLISNAIKYQDTDKENSFLKITSRQKDNLLTLSFEDNGLGIPQDNQKDMFTMFKRFHSKTSFGSGLGLYMIKKSADILGGSIEFEDTGTGSIFTLTLPNK